MKLMKKLRIGFILHISNAWFGGVNYFKNLLDVLISNPSVNIEPVIFVSPTVDKELLKGYPNVEIITSNILARRTRVLGIISAILSRILGRDYLLEFLLLKNNIDIVSHCEEYKLIKCIPTMSWIPDFQHKYLPNFFDEKEINNRDLEFERKAILSDCVILSSFDAKKDFDLFFPKYKQKGKVYQFVSPLKSIEYNPVALRKKYNIDGEFFYCPNQFWVHKNHKIILYALELLKDVNVQVFCSGNTEDFRNRVYYEELIKYVNEHDLQKKFHSLGTIPFCDVQSLMQECKALINPSLFEGWSTMVEEGKSLGKRMILSDLNVHIEQNAKGAVYFNRYDASDLAEKMKFVWECSDYKETSNAEQRFSLAAIQYRAIVDDTLELWHEKKK